MNFSNSVWDSLKAENFTLNFCIFLHLEVYNPKSSQKLPVGFASIGEVIKSGSMRWFGSINSMVIVWGK